MPIYKQTTEITNIDSLLSSVERDIEEVYFGDKQVFTVWGEYDGTLPATYNANGSTLADYRVYGAAGGVGDRTKNLFNPNAADVEQGCYYNSEGVKVPTSIHSESGFIPVSPGEYTFSFVRQSGGGTFYVNFYDANKTFVSNIGLLSGSKLSTTVTVQDDGYVRFNFSNYLIARVMFGRGAVASYIPYGYEVDMSVRSANKFDPTAYTTTGFYLTNLGGYYSGAAWRVSDYIPVVAEGTYLLTSIVGQYPSYCWYNANKEFMSGTRYMATSGFTDRLLTAPRNAAFLRFSYVFDPTSASYNEDKCMVVAGSTAPPYQPYYNTIIPIYIGSDPLGEDEYVDYGTGKVYRRTKNLYNGAKDIKNQLIYPNNGYSQFTTDYDSSDFIPISEGTYTISLYNDNRYDVLFRVNFYQSPSVLGYQNNLIDTKIFNGYAERQISIAQSGYIRIGFSHYTHERMLNIGEAIAYQPYLQPTDPPVPLPRLPTCDGVTITDYAGQSAAPSRFYAKYKKKGF